MMYQPLRLDQMVDGEPVWTLGVAPLGSIVSFPEDPTRYKTTGKTTVADRGASIEHINPDTPIEMVELPNQKEIHKKFERLLATVDEDFYPVPMGITQVMRANAIKDVERCADGRPAQGPKHNPSDRLRVRMDYASVPENSFFTLFTPRENSTVYVKVSGDECLRVCTFTQWLTWKDFSINLKDRKQFSNFHGTEEDDDQPLKEVTVLSAMSVEDFERDIDVVRKALEMTDRPLEENFIKALLEKLKVFWNHVEQKGTGM